MTETSKSLQVNRIHNARQAGCSCKTFSFRLLLLQMQANAIPDYTVSSEKQELVAAGSPGGPHEVAQLCDRPLRIPVLSCKSRAFVTDH